ncbi:diguanylate cyclase domain-containing protein [Elioraea sp.]|uniref:sensor domain-containing diguanylate cyclase n=1 Tax=Elioraea sp. TaxID=2185103 RepID=UPI00307D44ED
MTLDLAPSHFDSALRDALLDSRQRWRDLVDMAADFAWETDAEGRFTFVFPDPVLGWAAGELIGRSADDVLAEGPAGMPTFSPFRPDRQRRGVRAWLRRADGRLACLSFAGVPLVDADGTLIGARGVGRDVTEEERSTGALATALRREALIDAVLQETRSEVLAKGMLAGAARAMMPALGAAGAAILRRTDQGLAPVVTVGETIPALVAAATRLDPGSGPDTVTEHGADGRPLAAAAALQPGGGGGLLMIWRGPGARAWDAEERVLIHAAADFVGLLLAQEAMQAEMLRQARTDPLTGLLNRRAFFEELDRRLERLDRQSQPGALLFVDLDNLKPVNDRRGHEAGDAAIRAAAGLLRAAVRPTDLVARIGGDEFALWLDGADQRIAIGRAERIVADAPLALAHHAPDEETRMSLSVGIAIRAPGTREAASHLMMRADAAMYAAKRGGKAGWSLAAP